MSTLTQLIVELNALLGDSAGNRWRTAVAGPPVLGTNDSQYLLNLAAVEFNLLTGVYRKAIPVQVQAGLTVLVLLDSTGAPPYGPILRLEDDKGKALLRTTEGHLTIADGDHWRTTDPGTPIRYTRGLDGYGTLRLWPPPKSNAVFTAYVVAEPIPMLAGNDLPWIGNGANRQDSPSQYHSALPFYGAWYGLLFNQDSKDLALAQAYKQEFDLRAQRAAAEVKAAMEP